MKLYLSSYKLGSATGELMRLLGDRPKTVAFIPNALDSSSNPERRKQSITSDMNALEALGLQVEELDLRLYFNKTEKLSYKLKSYSIIFASGGNCFILRRAFKASGLDDILPSLIKDELIIYGGYSAGIDQIVPSLHGAELVDDPHIVPDGYDSEIIWDGLQLLPYTVAPHYKSDHPESADVDKSIEYLTDNHIPFIALRDGEVIVIDGQTQKIFS